MYSKSRKDWVAQAEELALQKTRDLTLDEQNEFWLKYHKIFLPHSPLSELMEFCGEIVQQFPFNAYICTQCGSEDLQEDEAHADTICVTCASIQPWPVTSLKHRLLEGQAYIRKKGYTPEDHMSSILTEMQCGRSRDMQPIIEDVACHLKGAPITFLNVRGCLRQLGYRQHYLMIPSILHGLDRTGFRPWVMQKGCLKNIQALFFQYKKIYENMNIEEKENRKNSLNYHYLLQQFCKMLGIQDIPLRFLRTPQGAKSIQQHERLWKKIQPLLVMYQ